MVDRILELLKDKNLSPSQFADEIGIQRSGMSHILSGRNKPSLEFVMKVLKRFPDIRPDWLLSGAGDLFSQADQPFEPVPLPETGNENEVQPEKEVISTLFDEQKEEPRASTAQKPLKPALKRERQDKKIERIIVFYDDRSFREYVPEN